MAADTQQLEAFVKEALQSGNTKKEIANVLEGAGWPSAQITSALDVFSDTPFSVPVPKPRPSLSARDAFLYIVMFSTLYYGVINLGRLLFNFIDRALPDSVFYETAFRNDSRWETASIIISFPVFFFMAHYIGKQVKSNPFRRFSPIRRWLTYMTLFVAASALLCDTTTLLYRLLGGDLTIRFILKALVVAVIAGTGFSYYLLDLRKEEKE